MAKKKGKGKKGKKGKKDKKAKDMTEVTREMYEITVKDLTEKLDHCRKKCATLEESNTDLNSRFNQLTVDLADVISFLKLRLERRQDELAELTERLEGLDVTRTQEQAECADARSKLETDMKRMQAELTSEVQMLSSKLSSLEEFRRMREKLLEEKAGLEHRLEEQRAEAEERVYQADKQRIIDSDQLKRDCTRNISGVAQAFREATRRRINQTTHRTIRENICLTAQMALVAEKARSLDARNVALSAGKVENDRVLGALEWTEQSLVSATRRHEAQLAGLEEHNRELAELAQQRGGDQRRHEAAECRVRQLESRLGEQQLLLETAAVEQQQQALLVGRLGEQLAQAETERDRLQTIVVQAGSVVRQALAPAAGGEPRHGLLERLLAVLTAASLYEQPRRLRLPPPPPLDQLPERLKAGALGLLPGGDGALRLRSADSLIRELEDAAALSPH